MDLQNEIIRITSEYLEDDLDFLKLSQASKRYKFILEQLCGQNMDVQEGREDIIFDNGQALGTFWAALCVDDLLRTRQFIRGINEAIKEKISKQKTVHILYAGTGPFATLILPLIFRYSKQNVKYTFLEVNPFSFKLLQILILKLGLGDFDITSVNIDATKYQIDSKNEPDIIISETMQNALAKEQQVPIFLNLMSQVKKSSIFIPEKIELFVGLKEVGIPIEELQAKHFHKERKVFEVSKEALIDSGHLKKNLNTQVLFPKKLTIIECERLKQFGEIVIITEIQVYKNEKIGIMESGLTTPIVIKDTLPNRKNSITIKTQYIISSEPKLELKIA